MDLHPFRQRTFKQRATLSGIGLHSGAAVRLTLAPAPRTTPKTMPDPAVLATIMPELDTTPPVLACPSNLTVLTCNSNIAVIWSLTATDNCSSVTVTSSPPPGTSWT